MHGQRLWRARLKRSWPLVLTVLVVGAVELEIGDTLTFGMLPTAFLFEQDGLDLVWHVLMVLLSALAVVVWLLGRVHELRELTVVILSFHTLAVLFNVAQLATTLHQRMGRDAVFLLLDGALIWVSNVVVFAAWYWLLDAGGGEHREPGKHAPRDFLFPQQATPLPAFAHWQPNYLDYLFLAFSTSTAFSATDTQTLSRRAKLLQMLQAAMALAVVTTVIARAINIIPT